MLYVFIVILLQETKRF